MISPIFSKLIGWIMERKINKDEDLWCCFVDFHKAFYTVPRKKLWERLLELGVPAEWRATVHRLCEQVKAKIKTQGHMSDSFNSDIGVKVKTGLPSLPQAIWHIYIYIYIYIYWKDGFMRKEEECI
jgi:hypothetical protein